MNDNISYSLALLMFRAALRTLDNRTAFDMIFDTFDAQSLECDAVKSAQSTSLNPEDKSKVYTQYRAVLNWTDTQLLHMMSSLDIE